MMPSHSLPEVLHFSWLGKYFAIYHMIIIKSLTPTSSASVVLFEVIFCRVDDE